ncbi:MAG: recombination protein RecR [Bacteroidaceae bacterium]|nr:recombination protein RecR [Bacteroidaceae bacterium]
MTNYPSKLLEKAVDEVSRLPGVGRRSAMRLVLHLLRQDESQTLSLADALKTLRTEVHYCRECHNISDTDLCEVCANPRRDHAMVCVVQTIEDVMAIEATQMYRGVYHVLGGVISPMDGIGPRDLEINSLLERIGTQDIKEVILALSPTMEGDTTGFYIFRQIQNLFSVNGKEKVMPKVTVLARGIAQNDELHYADEITLGRALAGRTEMK